MAVLTLARKIIMSKELHLCVVMSDSYLDIYRNIFNQTLPREFSTIDILHIRDLDSTPGLVGEENFKNINYRRLQFVRRQMTTYKGDNLLVLDIDAVCFRNFKNEINDLLENNDMVFQRNPHYRTKPYCIATWALQCSEKNMDFFYREVMPRAEALKITKEMWDHIYKTGKSAPGKWFHHLDGKQTYYDGDACVINAAILESDSGKELNVALLPDTYTQDPIGGSRLEDCVLYQCAGNQGATEKAAALINTYHHIKAKVVLDK